MPDCRTCIKILDCLFDPKDNSWEVDLGSFKEAFRSPCKEHTAIVKYLNQVLEPRYFQHRKVRFALSIDSGERLHVEPLMKSDDNGIKYLEYAMGLVRKREIPSHPGRAITLDSQWINTDTIRGWIEECTSTHGEGCENPMKIQRNSPKLLIDVKRRCIVQGTVDLRYVALSYRMGNMAPFRMDEQMLQNFKVNFALDDRAVTEKLPLAVRHAILLTQALGEDYLWTDVLCMVHRGHATFDDQLNKMAAIYVGAVFTIVATDGDGLVGIKGLRNISERRDPPQQIFPIGQDLLVMHTSLGSSDALYDNDLQYHQRAWTYQEFVMSPRKVIFVNQRPYWVCACCEWHEDDACGTNHKDSWEEGPREITLGGYTSLESLNHMISQYNERSLTYGGDALPAISGMLAVLSRKFVGGFLHGLPIKFFDVALSWRHHHDLGSDSSKDLRKRMIPKYPERATKGVTGFPSWSWTMWQGSIEFGVQEAGEADNQASQYREVYETSPITSWYTNRDVDGTVRRRISSTWYIDRDNSKDRGLPLPEGWSRWTCLSNPYNGQSIEVPAVDGQPLGPTEPGNHWASTVYRHVDMQDARYRPWSYPYPMPKIDTSTPFDIPEQSPYLFCKTRKTSLWVHCHSDSSIIKVHPSIDNTHMVPMHCESDVHSLDIDMNPLDRPLALYDDQIVGLLHLHNAEQLEEDKDSMRGTTLSKRKLIDLVAISRCLCQRRDKHGWSQHHRINVLWVEWEEGVAYRLASGFILEGAWKLLDLQDIDLVLG